MYNWNKYTVIHNEIIVKKSVVKMNHFILALQFMTSVEWKQSQNIAVFQPCLSVCDVAAHHHFDFMYSNSVFF